jgi:hypothetical protein
VRGVAKGKQPIGAQWAPAAALPPQLPGLKQPFPGVIVYFIGRLRYEVGTFTTPKLSELRLKLEAVERGCVVPASLLSAPVLCFFVLFFVFLFWLLNRSRVPLLARV